MYREKNQMLLRLAGHTFTVITKCVFFLKETCIHYLVNGNDPIQTLVEVLAEINQ